MHVGRHTTAQSAEFSLLWCSFVNVVNCGKGEGVHAPAQRAGNFFSAVRGCPRSCARTNPWFRGRILGGKRAQEPPPGSAVKHCRFLDTGGGGTYVGYPGPQPGATPAPPKDPPPPTGPKGLGGVRSEPEYPPWLCPACHGLFISHRSCGCHRRAGGRVGVRAYVSVQTLRGSSPTTIVPVRPPVCSTRAPGVHWQYAHTLTAVTRPTLVWCVLCVFRSPPVKPTPPSE